MRMRLLSQLMVPVPVGIVRVDASFDAVCRAEEVGLTGGFFGAYWPPKHSSQQATRDR